MMVGMLQRLVLLLLLQVKLLIRYRAGLALALALACWALAVGLVGGHYLSTATLITRNHEEYSAKPWISGENVTDLDTVSRPELLMETKTRSRGG